MATTYHFVSSYGREGPFASDALAAERAEHLALRAAIDGRDDERPRVEASDGTAARLPPFGAKLAASDVGKLPNAFNVFVLREREAASYFADCAETLEGQMESREPLDPGAMKDPGARAIYTWTMRRAVVALLRRLPETRPLAEQLERRWFDPDA